MWQRNTLSGGALGRRWRAVRPRYGRVRPAAL